MTAAAEARVSHHPADEVAKTIVLHDGAEYLIAAIPASERLDLHKLRELLGTSRALRLANEEADRARLPDPRGRGDPPFGPMVPAAEVIDSALLRHERIVCAGGDHRHSLLLDPHDVVRITAARTAEICED